jgi:hypothetical protein
MGVGMGKRRGGGGERKKVPQRKLKLVLFRKIMVKKQIVVGWSNIAAVRLLVAFARSFAHSELHCSGFAARSCPCPVSATPPT